VADTGRRLTDKSNTDLERAKPSGHTQQAFRAIIHGRVQGVNFRYYTRQIARSLGLVGYVQNLADGTVQVVAQGEQNALRQLLSWLHKGPSWARVTRVNVTWLQPTRGEKSFEIRY